MQECALLLSTVRQGWGKVGVYVDLGTGHPWMCAVMQTGVHQGAAARRKSGATSSGMGERVISAGVCWVTEREKQHKCTSSPHLLD